MSATGRGAIFRRLFGLNDSGDTLASLRAEVGRLRSERDRRAKALAQSEKHVASLRAALLSELRSREAGQ
jgi:hypothetical protein